MDVILDSNVLLSDIRMESIRFKNLFDYLRRTNSSLVIPRLVREEAASKLRSMLETQARKTEQMIEAFNRLRVDKACRIQFVTPSSHREARAYRKKLAALAMNGPIKIYFDTDAANINEVFLRGVNRRAPANSAGEELRDVIIWLLALGYSRSKGKPVAFISADGGFWDKDAVHPHIKEDIVRYGGMVSLFRTIEEFVKSSSPKPKPLSAETASGLFDIASMTARIVEAAKDALSRHRVRYGILGTIVSINLTQTSFEGGSVYETSDEARFVELSYGFSSKVEVQEPPFAWSGQSLLGSISATGFGSASAFAPVGFLSGGEGSPFGTAGPTGFWGGLPPYAAATREAVKPDIRTFDVKGKVHISLRAIEGTAPEIELDSVEISSVSKVDRDDGS